MGAGPLFRLKLDRSERTRQIEQALPRSLDLGSALAKAKPYSKDFSGQLSIQIRQEIPQGLPELLGLTGLQDPIKALQNIWAVAAADPLATALFAQLARRDTTGAGMTEEIDRLVALAEQKPQSDINRTILLAGSPNFIPPDLGGATQLPSGLRLRYRLAHLFNNGADAAALITACLEQPNTTEITRKRELLLCFEALRGRERPIRLLRSEDLPFQNEHVLQLTLTDDEIRAAAMGRSIPRQVAAERLASDKARLLKTRELLNSSMDSLGSADFSKLPTLFPQPDEIELRALSEHLSELREREKDGLINELNVKKHKRGEPPWIQLPPVIAQRLRSLPRGCSLPRWWDLNLPELAIALSKKGAPKQMLKTIELGRLAKAWAPKDEQVLLLAGRIGCLLPQSEVWDTLSFPEMYRRTDNTELALWHRLKRLKDPRPALVWAADNPGTAIAWTLTKALRHNPRRKDDDYDLAPWSMPAFGTPEWYRAAKELRLDTPCIPDLLPYLKRWRFFVDPAAVHQFIAAQLQDPSVDLPQRAGWWLNWYAVKKRRALEGLRQIPEPLVVAILEHDSLSHDALLALESIAQPLFEVPFLRAKVRLAASPAEAKSLLLQLATKRDVSQHPIPTRTWRWTPGKNPDATDAAVLLQRNNAQALADLAERIGTERLEASLRRVARELPSSQRSNAAYLDLLANLGVDVACPLYATLGKIDPKAASGCKLDSAYERYSLPKKSGGTRLISVPTHVLKLVQRRILERLLDPLGQHDCAMGFVKGRSILDNAKVHVGQKVVANADISNCFPSVRWPLVLGAIRRDLGDQLLPSSVSLLVDICTAQGGLPIGAPTSPALLNRVLLRSDSVLQQAAEKRGCQYTRYADDLTFSGDHGAVELLGIAARTVSQIGLALDPKKTNIFRPGRRQVVTGLVVNEQVSIPRRIRKRLRAAVHQIEQGRDPHWHGSTMNRSALEGRLAFLKMIHSDEADVLRSRLAATKKKTSHPSAATPDLPEKKQDD
jgi:retron-type reverse transcriptase